MNIFNLSLKKRQIANLLGISLKDLEDLIKKKIDEYYGYIDENTAITIILKEHGLDPSILYRIRIIDLSYKMKISKIIVKINRIFVRKDNLLIAEVYDKTGKVKLIFKGDYKKLGDILKEGKVIEIRNAVVLRNLTLALFVNNTKLIREVHNKVLLEEFEAIDEKELRYITEFVCKILDKREDSYEALTDSFNRVFIKSSEKLEIGKNYIVKCYLKKPLDLISFRLFNTNNFG